MALLKNMAIWLVHLSKRHSQQSKLNARSKKRLAVVLMGAALFSGMLASLPARAFVTGGATEFTQIANNIQLLMQYAQQVQQYNTQLKQYQTQLKHLEQNPGGIMRDSLNGLLDEVGNVMSSQNAIGGSMAKIDGEILTKFGNHTVGSYAEKFKMWTDTSRDSLSGAMRAAGLHRDAYPSDASALKALFNQSQSSSGTVAAVQQLSAITTMQVQQSQKLGDLLASQHIAANAWMASQSSQQQATRDADEKMSATYPLQRKPVEKLKVINSGAAK